MKNKEKINARSIKRDITACLTDSPEKITEVIGRYSVDSLIGPVISLFYNHNPLIKFRAVKTLGKIVSDLFIDEKEKARIIMRRLMWNLNDESGGIGWGSPEAMGEVFALNRNLAEEFGKMLISYVNRDGNYLEHPELQKGALWGIGRCGKVHRDIFKEALPYLEDNFDSHDSETRGLSILAFVNLGGEEKKYYKNFIKDENYFKVFVEDKFVEFRICDLLNPEHPEN